MTFIFKKHDKNHSLLHEELIILLLNVNYYKALKD